MATASRIADTTPLRVTLLCAMIAILDGFDTQVIAYVAPAIASELGLEPAALGPVFAAGPAGLAIGAFMLGPLADKVGRKAIIIASTALFGLFALLTAYSQTVDHLIAVRFLTGIGLGAAMPNIIALTGEFAPQRFRATLITVMFGGLPLGSTIGGFVSAWFLQTQDWRGVFLLGGALPLLMLPVLFWYLPESPSWLMRSKTPKQGQGKGTSGADEFPVVQLFTQGRAMRTVLLWMIYFANLLAMYFLVSWLPTLLHNAQLSLNQAIVSTATLNFGGALGGVLVGWLIDRGKPLKVLGWAYAFSAVAIVALAFAGAELPLLMAAAGITGFAIIGAQTGCHVVTSLAYPATIRVTGVGWALGVGRIGAISGPLLGGMLVAREWAPRDMILTATVPALVALTAVLLLAWHDRQSGYRSSVE